jgi:hypothetical protein
MSVFGEYSHKQSDLPSDCGRSYVDAEGFEPSTSTVRL